MKLKPCPFCKNDSVEIGYCSESYRSFFIECTECGAQGPDIEISHIKHRESGRHKAAEAWNNQD